MIPEADRLVLGAAQLGMDYGIANRTGRPDAKVVDGIVRTCWEAGIRRFDTAQAYGESETALGNSLKRLKLNEEALVATKPDPGLDHLDPVKMRKAAEDSLHRLGVSRLSGWLLHRESYLDDWGKGLESALSPLVEAGLVESPGVSVYSPDRAISALETNGLDMVQIPSNALDRRFERSGVFKRAAEKSKKLLVRGVFLQGLLLMDPKSLKAPMKPALRVMEQFRGLAADFGLTLERLALGYAREAYPEARIIIAGETESQIAGAIEAWSSSVSAGLADAVQSAFPSVEEWLLNPAKWPKGND